MKSLLLIAVILISLLPSLQCQVYLQLERSGTLKTFRFSPGDILTFRLKNDEKGWYERYILSLDVSHNRIIFPDVLVALDSIDAILLDRKAVGAQIAGTALQAGGVNLILFAAQDAVFQDRDFDWTTATSGLLNIAAGTAIKKIFRKKVFRISTRKRLRIVDLNFAVPPKT